MQELARRKNAEYFENLGRFTHLENTENILKGLVCCADCKRPLVRYKNVSHEKKLWYTCTTAFYFCICSRAAHPKRVFWHEVTPRP